MQKAKRTCPRCQREFVSEDLEGLCPACVGKVAFAPADPVELSAGNARHFFERETPREESPLPEPAISDPDLFLVRPSVAGVPIATVGPRIGNYELLKEIGRGGMGVVFQARQRSLNRLVAIKMISAGPLASESYIRRFRMEAETAASLQHPNIVAIHEIGEHQGQPYFAMDYVEGRSLAEAISDFGFRISDFRRTAQWMKTLAEAIHYAHEHGIIHRDLKPSNVLIDADDQPHVTDFGLAKLVLGDSELTLTGQVLGSPNYLPPEQASGERGSVGPHSDLYSLGAILYHLLTGRPPFVAETIQGTLTQVLNSEPVAPHLLNPSVPVDLETICLKCLEKEPVHRYFSARELAEELERFLDDRPIRARPISRAEKYWRWCRRNPTLASLGAATILLLLGVLIGSPIATLRINRERERAEGNAEESRRRLVRLNVVQGTRLVEAGDLLSALPWFAEAFKLEQGDRSREEIHRLRIELILQQCPKLVHCWIHEGPTDPFGSRTADDPRSRTAADARFSPDGRRVATIGGKPNVSGMMEGEVQMWDVWTGSPVFPPLKHRGKVHHVEFSPDGRRLVTASGRSQSGASVDGETRVWDVSTGQPVTPPLRHDGVVNHASFSPDGRAVVASTLKWTRSGSLESDALIWDAAAGTLLAPPLPHPYELHWARFSQDGRQIVTLGLKWTSNGPSEYDAQLWDALTGERLSGLRLIDGPLYDVRFSSNRVHLLLSTRQAPFEARIVDLTTGELVVQPMPHEQSIIAALFSPDGSKIASGGYDKKAYVWDVSAGSLLATTPPHTPIIHASFHPSSRQFVTAGQDGTARVWDAQTAAPISSPLPDHASVVQASFSPDGRRILIRDADRFVRIWALTAFDPLIATLTHQGRVSCVEFSPDGRRLLTASVDGTAQVWNAETWQPVSPSLAHSNAVVRARFSPNGRLVATASDDGAARVWEASSGQPLTPPLRHRERVWSVEFSPDGSRLVTASGRFIDDDAYLRKRVSNWTQAPAETHLQRDEPGEARVWNAETGALLLASLAHSNSVTYAEFSPDGRRIVTASLDGTARIWDAVTGQPITPFLQHETCVYSAAFSPDGRRVITACADDTFGPGTARVWDAATGHEVLTPLKHTDGVDGAIFSPDGRFLATHDKSARIWDAESGHALSPLLTHTGTEVTHVAFSRDSRLLVTSAYKGARVWDALTGEPVSPMLKHPSKVRWCAFSPDSRQIVTASEDGVARVWDLRPYGFPREDLLLFTQLFSARQINRSGSDLELLDLASLQKALRTLRAKYPKFFSQATN